MTYCLSNNSRQSHSINLTIKMNSMLITGALGFVGQNISRKLGERFVITTIGRGEKNDIVCDLRNSIPKLPQSYDYVVHIAGLAHDKNASEEAYMGVNYEGTKRLTQALDKVGVPKSLVFISSVAVYGLDRGENIEESHSLNGKTPYARSKVLSEHYLKEWAKRNNVVLTILRPSLIAGKNPKGNLGAMVRGIENGRYLSIGKADARKSVLMVEDIANVIFLSLEKGGVYNICDDYHPTFRELENLISQQLGNKFVIKAPLFIVKGLALLGDVLKGKLPIDSNRLDKITNTLTFSNAKAKRELGWTPLDVISNFRIR